QGLQRERARRQRPHLLPRQRHGRDDLRCVGNDHDPPVTMKGMRTMKNWIRIALTASAAAVIPACAGNHHESMGTTWVQGERLARPAINEGLFVTNDFLNAVNSISPDQDGAALVGPVAAEAVLT